ncbi:MAG: calcium-translocating P-type ATPase, PMCA-type [Oscillospiraceae bacterium]|nr:calcium-translocating P-type ATPase, PMCA-type [Oscillospiraceae bacterium]
MNAYIESKETLVKTYNTDMLSGLTDEQAVKNAAEFGVNSLTKKKPVSLLKRIWLASTEPMLILLIVAALIAVTVNIIRYSAGGHFDWPECIGIFVAIILSVAIAVIMEGKSAKAFEALNKINEDIVVKVIRNGSTVMLNQKDIVVGDILIISTGDRVPADGRLISSSELHADESMLTGESVPAEKDSEAVITDVKTPLAERVNMLYSGTFITSGFGQLIVTGVGDSTEFGKIAGELNNKKSDSEKSTPLQEKLARMSKLITLFGVIAAAIVFVVQLINFSKNGVLHFEEVMDAFVTSIVLIVAAVPEGLPTIVAVSLSINIIKLAKQNALVKKMIACETVGCVNIICSDKTGTLTENRMTVVNEITSDIIIKNIQINSTAELGEDNTFIGNPTECALLVRAGDYKKARREAEIVTVMPFSSQEKMMTTVVLENSDNVSYYKGSPERIMALCDDYSAEEEIIAYEEKSCRIIAFAHSINSGSPQFDGFAAIADPIREEVYEAAENCFRAGIEIKMLTGDNIITATAIANELHLLDGGKIAVEARELEELSDEELAEKIKNIAVIARSTPTIKMRVVKLLKEAGNVIAVTGDGINDAPAIKNADVGIAMGIAGTEVSKEASDIVLLNDSFATIARAIEWGRGIYENFKRFIVFQLTVNVSSVTVVLASVLMGLKEPFTALQLLWINIIMDGPPALTLGLEPPHKNLMDNPPVKRSENIVSKKLLARIGVSGLYISVVFLLQYTVNFLGATDEQRMTVLFALFAMFQLFNSFNCRVLGNESIFPTFFKNKIMLAAVSVTFVMQILIIQFAGDFFKVIPLSFDMWVRVIAVASSVIVLTELVKLVRRAGKKALYVIVPVIVVLSVLCLLLYNGVIWFNNPSTQKYPVRGVDVSSYQGVIDWEILADNNIDFAFIKATEGSSHVDEKFAYNWEKALSDTDLLIGAYHFFSYDSSGITQAENFIKTVPIVSGTLPPVIDIEFYGDIEKNLPSREHTGEILNDMLIILEEHYGHKPIIYATMKSYNLYIKNEYEEYPIWIRDVIKKPVLPDGREWVFWQYSHRETLNGYDGVERFIDMNVFYGSTYELRELTD